MIPIWIYFPTSAGGQTPTGFGTEVCEAAARLPEYVELCRWKKEDGAEWNKLWPAAKS